jgi:hypothetical protein
MKKKIKGNKWAREEEKKKEEERTEFQTKRPNPESAERTLEEERTL